MEILIVVAIIAVLVAVAIPIAMAQLEKTREAADLANARSAYMQVSTDALLGNATSSVTVKLKQKQSDWQSADPVNIGGIVHYKSQGDTDNWIGIPGAGGTCVVSYDDEIGVIFTWSGGASDIPGKPTAFTDFFGLLYRTGFWKNGEIKGNAQFEFDSRCPNSDYIKAILEELEKENNTLLQQDDCTWAYLGNGKEGNESKRYLFWTSLNTNEVGPGKNIPIIIQTGDGKFYVSESTTAKRTKENGYIAIADHLNQAGYKDILKNGTEYATLEEAYEAYMKALADKKYDDVRRP